MQFSILGRLDDRDDLDKWFEKNKERYEKNRKVVAVLRTTFFVWAGLLLFLFLVLAYRPLVSSDQNHFLNGVHIYRQVPEAGQMTLLENQNSFRRFTEYLARTLGLIPATCAVSAMSIQIPPATEPVQDEANPVAIAPDTSAPPLPLSWVMGENPEKVYRACRWRNEFISIVAAVAPGVGSVQKLTLFLLILGLVLVRRGALQLNLDAVCFPGRSKSMEWWDNKDRDNRLLVHPVMTRPGNQEDGFHPLFPTQNLSLATDHNTNGPLTEYRNHVYITRRQMDDNQLQQPFDLILQVLDSGMKHRKAGPLTDRLASATFDFRERVSNRLWVVDYILWLLPTIGFLGTIYGISLSLVRAKGLFDDDSEFSQVIRQVVDGLGVAFDTTSMALACSAVLFFVLRRTEAKIGPLADRAEETLTELLVNRLDDAPNSSVPHGSPTSPPTPQVDEDTEDNSETVNDETEIERDRPGDRRRVDP